jgi:predicted dehydrogenase
VKVGIIGCGAIVGQYLDTFARTPMVDLVAVADLDPSRSAAAAARCGAVAVSVGELLADPGVQTVVNLTVPAVHGEVAMQVIAAGKNVYGEKPLAATTFEARAVLAAAERAGVGIGCAPDTVLGTGVQTARKAIDEGVIGTPVAATATMVTPGPERWHPDPDFYYQPGGGPLLDMGPYYVTALVTLLGPVTSVIGTSSRARDSRRIGSGSRAGELIGVNVDTHVSGVLTHACGVVSTLVMSFEAVATTAANLEVHGDRGSLVVPDPNRFAGDVRLRGLGAGDWVTLPVGAGYEDAGRGVGLADLAATRDGDQPRAGGVLALHVLDVLESVLESAAAGRRVLLGSRCERPSAVPLSRLTTPKAEGATA